MFCEPKPTFLESAPDADHDDIVFSDFGDNDINNSNIALFEEAENENRQSPEFAQSSQVFPQSFKQNGKITDSYNFIGGNNEEKIVPNYPIIPENRSESDASGAISNMAFENSNESIIFLIKRIHYNNIIRQDIEGQNVLDTSNVPPWIGITIDNKIINRTPILFEDGGMMVAHGQLELLLFPMIKTKSCLTMVH